MLSGCNLNRLPILRNEGLLKIESLLQMKAALGVCTKDMKSCKIWKKIVVAKKEWNNDLTPKIVVTNGEQPQIFRKWMKAQFALLNQWKQWVLFWP